MPTTKKVGDDIEITYKVIVTTVELEAKKTQLQNEIASLQEQITIRETSLTEVNSQLAL